MHSSQSSCSFYTLSFVLRHSSRGTRHSSRIDINFHSFTFCTSSRTLIRPSIAPWTFFRQYIVWMNAASIRRAGQHALLIDLMQWMWNRMTTKCRHKSVSTPLFVYTACMACFFWFHSRCLKREFNSALWCFTIYLSLIPCTLSSRRCKSAAHSSRWVLMQPIWACIKAANGS